MATLMRDPAVAEMDLIAIQEPWRNPYMSTTHHPAKATFHLCYANTGDEAPTRTCFFVNRRLDHTKWQFKQHTGDACTIVIETAMTTRVAIHNVYNPHKNDRSRMSALPALRRLLAEHDTHEQIALGDLNLHHPLWGGPRVRSIDPEAEDLITIMEAHNMHTTLEPGTITYQEGEARTTIDLCWVTQGLVDRIIRSTVDESLDHDSDHLPISTILDLSIVQFTKTPKRNWKKLDENKFQAALKLLLPPLQRPRSRRALDKYTKDIATALADAADRVLPKSIHSPRARPGWNEECSAMLAKTKRLQRNYSRYHDDESWEAYRAARNEKTRTIRKALRQAHRQAVEKAAESPQSLWRIVKWARSRDKQPPSITPAIRNPITKREATDPSEKAEVFKNTFFPTPPEAILQDIAVARYQDQVPLPPITEKEVLDAIQAAAPYKAPGPDELTNRAIQAAAPLLTGHLTRLFNQSLHLGHCPNHFRESITVVLRKPGKDDYTVPKAYRPIALLNTIGKVMEAIIARRLSYTIETYQVLPPTHIGGRRQRSTEHALHIVVEHVYKAWRRGQVASLLLLDVSGAFDNVSHKRLLHNLRKRRVCERVVRWTESFLSNRRTRIVMDGYKSEEHKTSTGIPQGSPLSPLFYVVYNADLLEECGTEADTAAVGYIDDAAILAWGDTTTSTCTKLEDALRKAQNWADKHASVFAPEKFQLVHFTRARTRIDTTRPIQTSWGSIKPEKTCKYLGVTLDAKLRWKPHIEEIRQKVTTTINALGCLGGSTWGASMTDMRRIYRAVAQPQMMYACSLWSNSDWAGRPYTQHTLDTLQKLQARAARTISGAFKATSRAALDVETHLLPVKEQMWMHNADALARLTLSPNFPELNKARHRRARQNTTVKEPISPLQSIASQTKLEGTDELDEQEQIPPFVMAPWQQRPDIWIEDNADKARTRHDRDIKDPHTLSIYTDGSGINGQIGAAATCLTTNKHRSSYMGPDTTTTVYAAELQGINLALDIAQEETSHNTSYRRITIYTDNQAAIRSVVRPEGRSGAYIVRRIAQKTRALQARGHTISVKWIAGHCGILGNERADSMAKEATGWRADGRQGPRAEQPPELYSVRTKYRARCREEVDKRWLASWQKETKGRASFRYTPAPSKKVLRLHEGRPKQHSALLIQMRSEKIGLKDFLYKRKVPDISDPTCECNEGRQTVTHVVLRCRRHNDLRRRELGQFPGRNDMRAILSKRRLATKAIKFMELTNTLGQFRVAEE